MIVLVDMKDDITDGFVLVAIEGSLGEIIGWLHLFGQLFEQLQFLFLTSKGEGELGPDKL